MTVNNRDCRRDGELNLTGGVVCVFVYLLCLANSESTELTGRVLFSRTLREPYFRIIYNVEFPECVKNCDDHRSCKTVVYRKIKKVCELNTHSPTESTIGIEKGAFTFAQEIWKNKHGRCGNEVCVDGQTCDVRTRKCISAECPRLENTLSSNVSGNINSRGAKAIKTCNTGFVYPDANTSLNIDCDENGKWKPTNANWEQVPDCEPTTCKIMKLKSSTSMEYNSFDEGSKEVVKIFCVFDNNGGYTYISRTYLRYVKDPPKYYTINDHVMLRHKRSDNTQRQGRLSILPLYRDRYNVTIRVNAFTGFRDRSQTSLGSRNFILIGLVDLSFGNKHQTIHGYTFEGYDASYTNCDTNNNNEIFLVDTPDSGEVLKNCPNTNKPLWVACTWVERAASSSINLPEHYFYYYSMYMGGCGVRMNKITLDNGITVTGAAVGLRF